MKKSIVFLMMIAVILIWSLAPATPSGAAEKLRYSCSNQILEAFGMDRINAFTKATGIEVDVYPSSSKSAVYRLMNDFSDLAGSMHGLYYRDRQSGYVEIPFCKDPLAVIVNDHNRVEDLSREQIQGIFNKTVTNWKEVGGPDQPIIVVVPDRTTSAYNNFEDMAMSRREVRYDYISDKSSDVIQAIQNMNWGISFITQAAISIRKGVKTIKVDGDTVSDVGYPFFQTMYYITKGKPAGAAKAFIDFTLSDEGVAIMKEKKMIPVTQ